MMNLGKYIRSISQRHKPRTRWDTTYLMRGLLHPGNTPILPQTLPLPTTHMLHPPNGPTRAPLSPPCYSQKQWLTIHIQCPQPPNCSPCIIPSLSHHTRPVKTISQARGTPQAFHPGFRHRHTDPYTNHVSSNGPIIRQGEGLT